LTKSKPRRSIHADHKGEEKIDEDEQFQRILAEQRERAAQKRVQDELAASGVEEPMMKTKEDAGRVQEVDKREERREVLRKLVLRHVPLKDTEKSVEMFNTLLYGFSKNGAMEDAKEIFSQMESHDIPPNKMTFNILAKGYAMHIPPMVDDLQLMMNHMASTVGLDVPTFNALISSYAAIGRTANARQLFELMRSHNVTEDVSTCNLLLSNYARLRDGSALGYAEDLLHWMREQKIPLNSETYNSLIHCCNDDVSRAMDFYEASLSATKAGDLPSTPDDARLTAMLRVFAHAKQYDSAQQFIQSFFSLHPQFHLSPANQGAVFYLSVSCLRIKQAFDDLDAFFASIRPTIPVATCHHVVAALTTLPEAVLAENEAVLSEWRSQLAKYSSTTQNLTTSDADRWSICFLRWRETFTPNARRSP
jgi:pentatricopeptide repeat protein